VAAPGRSRAAPAAAHGGPGGDRAAHHAAAAHHAKAAHHATAARRPAAASEALAGPQASTREAARG
jgi:hypothetical protein